MPGEFVWRAIAAPYAVLSVLVVGVAITTALIRGDKVMRLGILATVAGVLVWAVTFLLATGTTDRALQLRLLTLGLGPVALVGPGVLLLLLGGAGQLQRHLGLVVVAAAASGLSMMICWTTPWMIREVRVLPSGLVFPLGGPLLMVHNGMLIMWVLAGVWISRHGVDRGRARVRWTHLLATGLVVASGIHDSLLSHGTIDSYPLVPICAIFAVATLWWYVWRRDVLRARGFDSGLAREVVALVAGAALVCWLVVRWASALHPLVLATLVATTMAAASGVALWWRTGVQQRRRGRTGDTPTIALTVGSEGELTAQATAAAASAAPLTDVRLWLLDGDGRLCAGDVVAEAPLDQPPRAYLGRHPAPIVVGDLATVRLGALREPLERALAACGPDVLLPLCEGDQLIGLIGARRHGGRAIRGRERAQLEEVGLAIARAATFLRRQRQAEVAADSAREVELAEASRAQLESRSGGEFGGHRLTVASRPAAGVALEAWGWEALDERRLAFFVADVQGTGVASALLSSSLVGAFSAAALGPESSNTSVSIAKELHRVLRAISPTARAAAIVGILDTHSSRLEWTNAGHRGGTLARRRAGTLASAYRVAGDSAPLGGAAPNLATGALQLEADQVLVIVSDGALGARDRRGRPWGEARLGAAIGKLAELVGADEAGADEPEHAAVVLQEILAYVDGEPLRDDVLVLAIAALPPP